MKLFNFFLQFKTKIIFENKLYIFLNMSVYIGARGGGVPPAPRYATG